MSAPFTTLILFFLPLLSAAQTESLLNAVMKMEDVKMEVTTDWKEIYKYRKEKQYSNGQVKISVGNDESIELNAEIRLRGNMRLEYCDNPPFKIKFSKDDLNALRFTSMNEWKVVVPCKAHSGYDQLLLKEFLAYKIWELISPHSFRTKLLYVKKIGSNKSAEGIGFVIEDIEELTDRLKARVYDASIISNRSLDDQTFLKLCLFQYMIGNTDWFVANQHNLSFIGIKEVPMLIPIPYDFDYAGLVSAPYAVHHESLQLKSITMRYYQGACHSSDEVLKALEIFHLKRDEVFALTNQIEGLSENSRKQVRQYIEEFYNIINDPVKLERQILSECGQWPVRD